MATGKTKYGKQKTGAAGIFSFREHKKLWITVIAAASALVLIAAVVFGFAFYVKGIDTIYPNVSIDGVDLGGKTKAQALDALNEAELAWNSDVQAVVNIYDIYTITVTAEEAGYPTSAGEAVETAYLHGRDKSLLANAVTWLKSRNHETVLRSDSFDNFDENKVRAAIETQTSVISAEAVSGSYTIGEESIEVIRGLPGMTVDPVVIYGFMEEQFRSWDFVPDQYDPDASTPQHVDLEALYDEIYVEPVNARYDTETLEATESVTGVSFDLDAAQKMYDDAVDGDTIVIPIIYTEPEFTTQGVNDSLYRDIIAECTTSLSGSEYPRVTNISLTAQAVNGTVLQPGDEFSFNGIVGERTPDKGYMEAGAYVAGENVNQYGGGICQTSSTIYYCVLHSNLEVLERECHMFIIGYLPLGMDATVDWGTLDLRFRNNRNYPIRIEAFVDEEAEELTVRFHGTIEDDTYVEIESVVVGVRGYETKYQEDPTVTSGEKEKHSGYYGYTVDVYKHIYDGDGTLLETIYLGQDIYEHRDRLVLVPVGSISPSPGTTPAATPAPTAAPAATPTAAPAATPEPTPEPTPAPTPEPTPEPAPEPTPTPAAEP